MEKLVQAKTVFSAVGMTAGVGIAHVVNEWLDSRDFGNDAIFIVVTLVLVTVLTVLASVVFERWILELRCIRRLILGRYYVEGTWLEIAFKGDAIESYGITRIYGDRLSIDVSGEDVSPSGEFGGRYTTQFLNIQWPCVRSSYRYDRSNSPALEARGFTELQFDVRNGPPVRYAGSYFQLYGSERVTYEGWKVTVKKLLAQLDHAATRMDAIQDFWEAAKPRLGSNT